MNTGTLRERLAARRAEVQEQIELVLPQVEQLEARIVGVRETIARLVERREKLAAYGDRPIEFAETRNVPEVGQFYAVELEPRRSRKSGRELAAEVQREIDEQQQEIKACQRQIDALIRPRRRRA